MIPVCYLHEPDFGTHNCFLLTFFPASLRTNGPTHILSCGTKFFVPESNCFSGTKLRVQKRIYFLNSVYYFRDMVITLFIAFLKDFSKCFNGEDSTRNRCVIISQCKQKKFQLFTIIFFDLLALSSKYSLHCFLFRPNSWTDAIPWHHKILFNEHSIIPAFFKFLVRLKQKSNAVQGINYLKRLKHSSILHLQIPRPKLEIPLKLLI